MTQKYAKLEQGGANPYIDPAGYRALIDSSEESLQRSSGRVEIGTS